LLLDQSFRTSLFKKMAHQARDFTFVKFAVIDSVKMVEPALPRSSTKDARWCLPIARTRQCYQPQERERPSVLDATAQ
jgi:hypothetical protein